MAESIRQKIEDIRKEYDVLIDNEQYKLDTQNLTEKERQKILSRLYQLQEEEKRVIHDIEHGRARVKSDGWENCPRCGSNRVKQKGKLDQVTALWVAGFVITLIGIIVWPLLLIGISLMLFSPIALLGTKMNVCRDCKKTWAANKK